MDFSLNTEQHMLQSIARKFATDILPAEAKLIEDNDVPPSFELRKNLLKWGFWGLIYRRDMTEPD